MWKSLRDAYHGSLKPTDTVFNTYIARPLATPLVLICEAMGLSPNQVTLMGLVTMFAGSVIWCLPLILNVTASTGLSPYVYLIAGLACLELAYLFDCADGQLARRTGCTSNLGASLDFLIDELKAFAMLASLSLYWWSQSGVTFLPLIWGLVGLVSLASAISMTRFVRSQAMQATGLVAPAAHGDSAKTRSDKGPFWWLLLPARLVSQYPQSLPIFVLFNRIDLFIMAYTVLHVVYAAGRVAEIFFRLFKRADRHKLHG
jgi:phosphatidylglycerophosphate synthase